jgi:hypothetical protein
MVVKTIKTITTSALFRLGKNTSGKEYTWLEQVAIEYLGDKAPLEGNVSLKCMYLNLGSSARVASLPADCMRISKIALKAGKHVWTLTVDNNLAIPENLFSCETETDVSSDLYSFWPSGWAYGWNNPFPAVPYTHGGGQNTNYYRIDGKNIYFEHNIPDGQLLIEYFSNGSDLNGDTFIDVTYSEPFRLYLMSEYCFHKGDSSERSKYKELQMQYEASQWNANILAKAPRLYEIIDALAQSSEFNLG